MTHERKITLALLLTLGVVSVLSYIVFLRYDIILAYYDASSRLNIARKMIDNLTPGIGQIGTLWLPLPQVLMLPLVWIDALWWNGFAGSIVSMISFVLTGFYLFKLVYEWGKSYASAILSVLLYITNVNVLYMQSTPMSEPFFLLTMVGAMYYFVRWVRREHISDVLRFAAFISLATLTRYEGYFSLVCSLVMIGTVLFVKKVKAQHIEGTLVLFSTLACTGVILWTVYQTAIFGDPIYWAKVYTQKASIISTENNRVDTIAVEREARKIGLAQATTRTFNAGAQMNGILITYFALAAFLYILGTYAFKKDREKLLFLLSLLIPTGAFLFTVVAIRGGFPLHTPDLSLTALFNGSNRLYEEYNIRYGLILLPISTAILGFFASKNKGTLALTALMIALQLGASFVPQLYVQYSIPYYFLYKPGTERVVDTDAFLYLKNNYDSGLILVSALKHDPEMFYFRIPYKNYIHEGTQHYWTESIQEPHKHATWIYMYAPDVTQGREEDSVTKELKNNPGVAEHFDLVYQDALYYIYRRKEG